MSEEQHKGSRVARSVFGAFMGLVGGFGNGIFLQQAGVVPGNNGVLAWGIVVVWMLAGIGSSLWALRDL